MGRRRREEMRSVQASSFTSDGDRLATLLPDGTVKIWDTRNGTVLLEWKDKDGDSAVTYSCISCGFIGKKHKKEQRPLLLALGTHAGDVLAIDVGSGEKKWTNTKCHTSGIATLLFANKGRSLYAAGTDGVVFGLNSETGELVWNFKASKRPITSLAISGDEKLVATGGDKTRVFNLADKKELLKFSSDLGPSEYLGVSDNAMAVVSSMLGQKQLQVWSCNYENKSCTADAILSMQTTPLLVDCRSHKKEGGTVVLSVSETGVAYVWLLMSNSQDGISPSRIMVKSTKGKTDHQSPKKNRIPILCAKLCDDSENARISVLVAYGSPEHLQFKSVELIDHGEDIFLTMEDDAQLNEITTSSLKRDMDAQLKEGDGGLEDSSFGISASSQKRKTKKRTVPDLDGSVEGIQINSVSASGTYMAEVDATSTRDAQRKDAMHVLGGECDMNEPTIAEKLANLEFIVDNKESSLSTQQPSTIANPPSADSVHILLKQALHADDRALLLDCLYTRDEKVIAKSTSLLNPADVLKLLGSLTSMIESRGAVLVCALPWLRSLLCQHASSIVSQESSLLILNSLYQIIESRISTLGSAVQLSTCVDYLFVGIPDSEAEEESTVPALIYEDKDSEEEEEDEDAMETEEEKEELGTVIDSPRDSNGSEVMSD